MNSGPTAAELNWGTPQTISKTRNIFGAWRLQGWAAVMGTAPRAPWRRTDQRVLSLVALKGRPVAARRCRGLSLALVHGTRHMLRSVAAVPLATSTCSISCDSAVVPLSTAITRRSPLPSHHAGSTAQYLQRVPAGKAHCRVRVTA